MAGNSRKSWSAVSLRLVLAVPFLLGASAATLAQTGAPELRIEPQHGQTQAQQWSDRYACYDWARNQSGFDPSRPSGGVPPEDAAGRRGQYRRALIACLEGRGYEVREAAASAPPPAAPPPATPRSEARHYPQRLAERPREHVAPEFKYRPFTVQLEGGYTVTVENAGDRLKNGWNAGLGFTWQPISALPLAFRLDGSYSRFGETQQSLNLASQTYGTNIGWGYESIYGGDVDAQISLRMGPSVREYFFGGIGRYREHTVLSQVTWEKGLRCLFFCYLGYIPVSSTFQQSTTGWLNSWNAGIGFEFALADPGSFFIEARYLHLAPTRSRNAFVPIRFGLRF